MFRLVDTRNWYVGEEPTWTGREAGVAWLAAWEHRDGGAAWEILSDEEIRARLTDGFLRAHRDALRVQDASNLIGVVNGFARAANDLHHYLRRFEPGTSLRDSPAIVLWLDKLHDMTGRAGDRTEAFAAAYDACLATSRRLDPAAAAPALPAS